MNWILRNAIRAVFMQGEGEGGGGGGGAAQVTEADARTFLQDFLPPDTVKSMDAAAVLQHHKTFSGAVAKHAPKAQAKNGEWYGDFQDPAVKEWLGAYKGAYPNAEAVALKALNLEKFIGAEKAGRGLVVPKADAKPEEWQAFFRKAGASEKEDAYILTEEAKKDPILASFRQHAHKVGMPVSHFNETIKWYDSQVKAAQAAHVKEWEANAEKELNEVHTEWGAQSDAKVEAGRRAAAAFVPGTPEQRAEVLNRMEGALGTKFTMNFWASIGEKLGEHGFVGDSGQPGEGGMSPEAARMEIQALKNDKEFGKKLINGDAEAAQKWGKLHSIGYPGQQAL